MEEKQIEIDMNDVVVHDASQQNSQRTNIFNSTSEQLHWHLILCRIRTGAVSPGASGVGDAQGKEAVHHPWPVR
jgi:hypothetical protein